MCLLCNRNSPTQPAMIYMYMHVHTSWTKIILSTSKSAHQRIGKQQCMYTSPIEPWRLNSYKGHFSFDLFPYLIIIIKCFQICISAACMYPSSVQAQCNQCHRSDVGYFYDSGNSICLSKMNYHTLNTQTFPAFFALIRRADVVNPCIMTSYI